LITNRAKEILDVENLSVWKFSQLENKVQKFQTMDNVIGAGGDKEGCFFVDKPHFLHLLDLLMPAESCICFKHSSASRKYTYSEDMEAGEKIVTIVGQPNEDIDVKEK